MTIPKWVREHAKTIATFAAAFVGNMVVSLIDGTTPFPQTKQEWTQYLVTSVGAAIAAWYARNKITQKQLDRDDHVVGGVVVDEVPRPSEPPKAGPASGPYVNPFPEPTL